MLELLVQWPVWYLALVAYCVYLAVDVWRRFRHLPPDLAGKPSSEMTPHERGQVAGYRGATMARIIAWLSAGAGLLTGADWVRAIFAVVWTWSVPTAFRDYAIGFATGRKAAELAAAPEYVMGRAARKPLDYAAAAGYVGVTRLIPAAAVLYAIWHL